MRTKFDKNPLKTVGGVDHTKIPDPSYSTKKTVQNDKLQRL